MVFGRRIEKKRTAWKKRPDGRAKQKLRSRLFSVKREREREREKGERERENRERDNGEIDRERKERDRERGERERARERKGKTIYTRQAPSGDYGLLVKMSFLEVCPLLARRPICITIRP
jgi:hypothetical protein